ncbi:unnamed protein product, partial [Effrenium voratum]
LAAQNNFPWLISNVSDKERRAARWQTASSRASWTFTVARLASSAWWRRSGWSPWPPSIPARWTTRTSFPAPDAWPSS